MHKVLGALFYIAAGFFVYTVCLLAFVNQPTMQKWGVVAGFSVPAIIFLCAGLATNRFQLWKRHTGIVLLSGSGFACFLIFTVACLLTTEEFRQQLGPETLTFFSAYLSGGGLTVSTAVLGLLLLRAETGTAEPGAPEIDTPQ
jgi:hypothetical protein